jgi:carbon monoxide dehydrogenase subunit G
LVKELDQVRIRMSATFQAPPERVWSVLADWERQASWMPDVAWLRPLGPERELGARLAVRTRVFGIPAATDLMTVTVWEPPARLRIDHTGVVRGWGEWRLDPAGEGTAFTWLEEFRMPPPVLGDLALAIYSPWQRWMLRRSISNLERLVAS